MKEKSKAPSREPVIDLLRFFSILVVMGSHFFPRWLANAPDTPRWIRAGVQALFLNGRHGVTCFFVVSGFLITRMMDRSASRPARLDLRAFYVQRAARLWPLLALTLLIAAAMAYGEPWTQSPSNPFGFFWFLPYGHGWGLGVSLATFTFNLYVILGGFWGGLGLQWIILWSLAVEEQFYFLYPLVFKKLRTREALGALLIAVVVLGIGFRTWVFVARDADIAWGQFFSPAVFDQLAVGCLAYWVQPLFKRWVQAGKGRAPLTLGLGFLVLGLGYAGWGLDDSGRFILGPFLVALGSAIFLLAGLEADFFQKPFWVWVSRPGRLSYGAYLWHLPILYVAAPFLFPWGRQAAFLAWLCLVFVGCEISYRWLELPLNRLVRSWFKIAPSRTLG